MYRREDYNATGCPLSDTGHFEWSQMQETVVGSVKWRRRGGKETEEGGEEQVSVLGVGAESLQGWG
jgi:hypothetical protein